MSKEQVAALIHNYGEASYRCGQFPANRALADNFREAHEALRAALASPAAEPVQALKSDEWQGGLTNDELRAALQSKLRPGFTVDDDDLPLFALGIEYALASPPATGWIPVSERLPESGVTVLAAYTNRAGNLRRICAEWIAAKSRESGFESDIGEYDDAADMFYDPEGWYERIDNWCDYTSVAVVEGEISHWMPLPPAPEGAA